MRSQDSQQDFEELSASGVRFGRDADDAELLRRVAMRDDQALEALYHRCSGVVFAVALRILIHRVDAEEVVQETFLHAWQRGREYRSGRGTVVGWLTMIARSRAIDRCRSANSTARTLEVNGRLALDDAEPDHTPFQTLERHGVRSSVESALESLPSEQRKVVEMAFHEGLSHSEIANATGIPLGTVKTRIRRGMEKLSGLLREL